MISVRSKLADLLSSISSRLAAAAVRSGRGLAASVVGAVLFCTLGLGVGVQAQTYLVPSLSSYAGNGSNGTLTNNTAATSSPIGITTEIVTDRSGNIYGASANGYYIYKIDARTRKLTIIAGTGTSGYTNDGSAATTAEIGDIEGMALDATGTNLYISDYTYNRVRDINLSTGIITTVAGSSSTGAYGGDGSSATAAKLNGPRGLAVSSSGVIYVSDSLNYRIRIFSPGGVITTLIGTGTTGNADGANASLSSGVQELAFDASGNLYFSDGGNCRVRVWNGTTVSNFAGVYSSGTSTCSSTPGATSGTVNNDPSSGTGAAPQYVKLRAPRGLAFDQAGDLYISDQTQNVVYMVAAVSGAISTSTSHTNVYAGNPAGSSGSSNGSAYAWSSSGGQGFAAPTGLAMDGNNTLYIGESGNDDIRTAGFNLTFPISQLTTSTTGVTQTTWAGFKTSSTLTSITAAGTTNEFTVGTPTGCTVGSAVTAYTTYCAIPITYWAQNPGLRTASLDVVTTLSGTATSFYASMQGTASGGMANFPSGTLSGWDNNTTGYQGGMDGAGNYYHIANGNVWTYSSQGVAQEYAAISISTTNPNSFVLDPAGNVYYWAFSGTTIYKWSKATSMSSTLSSGLSNNLGFGGVYDPISGSLYISTEQGLSGQVIYKINPVTGAAQAVVSGGTISGTCNGVSGASFYGSVLGMAVDLAGNLYAAANTPNCIVKIAAGTYNLSAAVSQAPVGALAVDPAGNLYVPALNGTALYKYAYNSSTGTYGSATTLTTTPYGSTGSSTYSSVTIDPSGNLYLVTPDGVVTKYTRNALSLTFSSQPAYSSTTQAVTVESNGNNTLGFGGLTFSNLTTTSSAYFTEAGNSCSTSTILATGSTCTVNETFTPTVSGTVPSSGSATGSIVYEAVTAPLGTLTVNMTGTATADVTTTTLTSGTNPSSATATTLLTATVGNSTNSTTPLGTVTFTNTTSGTTICSAVTLTSGTATCSYATSLTPGSYTLTASYTPSSTGFASSSGTVSQTVSNYVTTTTVTSSVNPSYPLSTTTLTATVANSTNSTTPLGTVTFTNTTSGTTICSAVTLSSGTATCSYSVSSPGLASGSYTLTATYTPSTGFASSSNTVTQVVNKYTSAIQWYPSAAGITSGSAIGTGILDPTAVYASGTTPSGGSTYTTVNGSFTYALTAVVGGNGSTSPTGTSVSNASSSTVPATGYYTITATFTPSDSTRYTTATATQSLVVSGGKMFAASSNGVVYTYSSTGVQSTSSSYGGYGLVVQGAAAGYAGLVWSLAPGSTTQPWAIFWDTGVELGNSGLTTSSNATVITNDGSGYTIAAYPTTSTTSGATDATAGQILIYPFQTTESIAGDVSIGSPTGIAVDAAGSIWVTSGNNTVIEVIGSATPVMTPLVNALSSGTLTARP